MLRRQVFRAALGALGASVLGRFAWARAADPGYDYHEIGDLSAPRPKPTRIGLMLVGGGDWPYDAFRWMIGCAGGGRIVVLRASYGGENGEEIYRQIGGVTAVQTFVFRNRKAAYDPRVLDAVRNADGVFLGGGDQAKYVRFWKGAPLNELIDAHVRAGKPIGGTSAGLAVLGAYAYGALDGGSITAPQAMRDPMGPAVTLVRDFLHLPFLGRVITDSHFSARERLGRLIAFLARLIREQGDPSITGIGVDENTALCIDDAGIGRVITGSGGHAWVVRPQHPAATVVRGRRLDFSDIPITVAGVQSRVDLKTLEVDNPAFRRVAEVRNGVLTLRDA